MQLTLIVSNLNEEGGGEGSKPLTLDTVDSRFERFLKVNLPGVHASYRISDRAIYSRC